MLEESFEKLYTQVDTRFLAEQLPQLVALQQSIDFGVVVRNWECGLQVSAPRGKTKSAFSR